MASSLRLQPSALSALQRQAIADGQVSSRKAKWLGARNASIWLTPPRQCCQRASRVASTSQTRLSSPITERRERRSFIAASTSRQQDLDLGPDEARGEGEADDIHLTQLRPGKGATTTASPRGTLRSAKKSHGRLLSPLRASKVMREFYDGLPTTEEDWAQFQSSEGYSKLTMEGKEELKKRLIAFIKREPAMMEGEIKDCTTNTESISVAQRHLDKSYFALLLIAQLGGDPRHLGQQVETAGEFAKFGDRLIKYRKEEAVFSQLQSSVGRCLLLMIKNIEDRQESSSEGREWTGSVIQCLRSQAFSFQSNESVARRQLESVMSRERHWLQDWEEATSIKRLSVNDRYRKHQRLQHMADALGSLLQISLNRSENAGREEQDKVARRAFNWLIRQPNRLHFNTLAFPRVAFRLNVLTRRLRDPRQYLHDTLPKLDHDGKLLLVSSICASLLRQQSVLPAYNIYVWLKSIRLGMNESTVRQMIRVATAEKEFALASVIMADLVLRGGESNAVLASSTYRMMASSYGRMQDESNMEKMINLYCTHYPAGNHASDADLFIYECRLLCYVQKGDVKRTRKLIQTRYDLNVGPKESSKDGLLSPDYQTHARLVMVYLNKGQIDEAEATLHRMVRFDHPPSVSLLNAVLKFYVGLGDTHSVLSLFKKMVEAGLKVDVNTYTTLISLFAKMRENKRAETVFETMKKNDVKPDRAAYTALLNAHVEAGEYKEAVLLFEWLLHQDDASIRPSTIAYNVMLKAHVLRAVSVQETVAFFKHMKSKGMEPSQETYGMLLLSVTDAGLMDLAEDVFGSVEELLGGHFDTEAEKGAGMYHFTAMIQGYLRVGNVPMAKNHAIELRRRGFKATGVLWAILVKAYSFGDASTKLEDSYRMVQSALFDSKQEYAAAYDPLIHALCKRADVTQVESLLQELSEKGTEIPFNFWVSLLDGFRRRDDLSEVTELWNLIYDKASKKASEVEVLSTSAGIPPSPMTRLEAVKESEMRSSLLCVPLSILIDTLSRHEKHEQIAQEWIRCRKAGFAFDSHNWNHLCVSFLKAGRVRDSLNIIEQVLNTSPPDEESDGKTMQDIIDQEDYAYHMPGNSLSFGTQEERADNAAKMSFSAIDPLDLINSPSRPPNRRRQGRLNDDKSTSNPLRSQTQVERVGEERRKEEEESRKDLDTMSSRNAQSSEQQEENVQDVKERDEEKDRLLLMEPLLRASRSPWYAHFDTMWQLKKTMERIQDRGGIIQLGHNQLATLNDLFKMYPRVRQLMDIFERKVENFQEKAREQGIRRASRRR